MARKPNFFILGAPKCGTTSLSEWLATNPQIFMAPEKEPHFFNTDERQFISEIFEYNKLFSAAKDCHIALGEASVWYLYSTAAVPNILRYQPDARFIVMLRNPVEMAPALHAEMLLSGHEDVADFLAAWELQDERRNGRAMPTLSWAGRRFLYGDACKLGAQLARLLEIVPKSRVHPVLLENIAANPRQEYLRVLKFLGVDDDGRTDFPIYNSARTLRWPRLNRALFIAGQMKRRLGISAGLSLTRKFSTLNAVESPRDPLSAQTRAMLQDYFSADIAILSKLLDQDLGHWGRDPATGRRSAKDAAVQKL